MFYVLSVYRSCVVYAVSVIDLPQIAAPCTKAAAEGDTAHSLSFPYFHLRAWHYSSYCSRSSPSLPASPPPMLCFHTLNPCLTPLLPFSIRLLCLYCHIRREPPAQSITAVVAAVPGSHSAAATAAAAAVLQQYGPAICCTAACPSRSRSRPQFRPPQHDPSLCAGGCDL